MAYSIVFESPLNYLSIDMTNYIITRQINKVIALSILDHFTNFLDDRLTFNLLDRTS